MKHTHFYIFLILSTQIFQSCSIEEAKPCQNEVVTICMEEIYPSDLKLFEKFKKETNISVKVRILNRDTILGVLKQEKYNSNADILLLQGIVKLKEAKEMNLFKPIDSDILKNIDATYKSKDKDWFSLCKTPIVIVYKHGEIEKKAISEYHQLLHSQWKGKLVFQYGNTASLSYFKAAIQRLMKEKSNEFIDKLYQQTNLPFEQDDFYQIKRISNKKGTLALIELSSLSRAYQIKDSNELSKYQDVLPIFPSQRQKGCFINVSGAGVYKYARNSMNAKLLLEFMIRADNQEEFSKGRHCFPIHKEAKTSDELEKFGKFRGRFIAI
jgi:iron(III) transport system substrate-binding protein